MLAVARTLKALGQASASSTSTTTRWPAPGRTRSWRRSRSSGDCGLETIPHQTPRDTSIMGLESLLLGAHAEGVRNVLSVTGDPPEVGDYPGSQRRLRRRLDRALEDRLAPEPRRGLQRQGRSTRRPRSSSASRSTRRPTTSRPSSSASAQKVEAGAKFAMTQIAVRPLVPRALRGAARRLLADPAARRDLLRSAATSSRFGCTTRCRASSSPRPCSAASSRPARTRAPRSARARAGALRGGAREGGRRLRDPAVQTA